MIRSKYVSNSVLDAIFEASSQLCSLEGFHHIRADVTIAMSDNVMAMEGFFHPETADGGRFLIPRQPFQFGDEIVRHFFDELRMAIRNPDASIHVQLVPKFLLVYEPTQELPFRAEVSIDGCGVNDLTMLLTGGVDWLLQTHLGCRMVVYIQPISQHGGMHVPGTTQDSPLAGTGRSEQIRPSAGFSPQDLSDMLAPLIPMDPSMKGRAFVEPQSDEEHSDDLPAYKFVPQPEKGMDIADILSSVTEHVEGTIGQEVPQMPDENTAVMTPAGLQMAELVHSRSEASMDAAVDIVAESMAAMQRGEGSYTLDEMVVSPDNGTDVVPLAQMPNDTTPSDMSIAEMAATASDMFPESFTKPDTIPSEK